MPDRNRNVISARSRPVGQQRETVGPPGTLPAAWSVLQTRPSEPPAVWGAVELDAAPSGKRALFEAALTQPADGRDAWLREACGDDDALRAAVERLLGHDALDVTMTIGSAALTLDPVVGSRIGPYKVLDLLGEGFKESQSNVELTRLEQSAGVANGQHLEQQFGEPALQRHRYFGEVDWMQLLGQTEDFPRIRAQRLGHFG